MTSRVLTIPNILTLARLIFLPFLFAIALSDPVLAAIIAAFLGFTDFLDGYIARRFNQESELGRILDPISDRALVLTTFVVFTITQSLPLWYVVLVGSREVLITIGTAIVFLSKKIRLDINQVGKVSAFAAMAATPAWVFYFETSEPISNLWLVLAVIGSIITIPSGFISLFKYYQAFRNVQ